MILVGGEALIDFISVSNVDGLPHYQANPGGSPYNVAMALGLQQEAVGFLTPMSSDTLGSLLHDRLVDCGVSVLADRVNQPTSMAVVSFVDGQPAYQFYREGTADRQIDFQALTKLVPEDAKIFQVGSLGLTAGQDAQAWSQFFAWCKQERGMLVSLDPNIRAAFIQDRCAYLVRLDQLLDLADVVKLSDEDLEWIAGRDGLSRDELIGEALALKAKSSAAVFVLTLGAEGAVGLFGDHRLDVKPQKPDQMGDTVGAGDTFMATMLAELSRRQTTSNASVSALNASEVQSVLDTAAKAAAINVSRQGCNPPTLVELKAPELTPTQ